LTARETAATFFGRRTQKVRLMLIRHTRLLTALTLILSSVALTGCGSTDDDPGKTTTPVAPAYDFSAFDASVSQFLAEKNLKGASIVIVHKDYGIVHSKGYGEYDANRLYVIASSSKVLSVGVLMRLADQKKLDIDAPIGNVLSAWQGNKPELTVAQLVSNSSGLVGLVDNPLYGPYLCQYIDSFTLDACAQAVYKGDGEMEGDRKPPDTVFRYGGGPWQLAGGIAQVAGGKPWKDLVRETYVDPCDTDSLGYTNQYTKASANGGVAAGLAYPTFFDGDPSTLPVSDNPSIEGGAYITAQDYGKVLLMHLRGGVCENGQRALSAAAVARMQEDRIGKVYGGTAAGGTTTGALEGQGYGLGWWVERAEPGVVTDAGAYGAMPWIDNPRGYAGFIALQSDAGTGTLLRVQVKPLADAAIDAFAGK
jgi:CubicO group peptidase (beta-lactamase class C family)